MMEICTEHRRFKQDTETLGYEQSRKDDIVVVQEPISHCVERDIAFASRTPPQAEVSFWADVVNI